MDWIESNPVISNDSVHASIDASRILNRELAKRNLHTADEISAFLYPDCYHQISPFSFPDMEKAVNRIIKSIKNGETIGIWGDFDADGQTSTAILFDGLTRLGANVIYHIPVRASESHGMQINALKTFMRKHPALIITCDTGISENTAVEYAQLNGIDVIITDHHSLPGVLPEAYAVINPHQLPSGHPLVHLSGVGTAFQVLRAFTEKEQSEIDFGQYYDLVAVGTIADLAQLKLENRFYAQMGLTQMNRDFRAAFRAMAEISQTKRSNINENTVGFNIAPRLNAAGRLSNANDNVKFLLSEDLIFCSRYAKHLEQLNFDRKMGVDAVLEKAELMIKKNPSLAEQPVLLLCDQEWQAGVLGIAASKLVETFNRPAILLKIENGIAAGSARSIEGIDITASISENEKHLIQYGGHAMAAGLSLSENKIAEFSRRLWESVRPQLEKIPLKKNLLIDHVIDINSIDTQLLNELVQLSPFGQGNTAPIFASRNLEVISTNYLGNTEKHNQITVLDIEGHIHSLISWNSQTRSIPYDRIDFAFYIRPDEYRGDGSFYLEYIDHQEHTLSPAIIDSASLPFEIEDHRHDPQQVLAVKQIITKNHDVQIWFEGVQKPSGLNVYSQTQLQKNKDLIILSAPYSREVFDKVIKISKPKKVFLFNLDLHQDDMRSFLSGLGGLIKHLLKNPGLNLSLKSLSIQLGQTEQSIFYGLSWFKEQGNFNFACDADGNIILDQGVEQNLLAREKVEINLNKSLKETYAFRKYYKRAPARGLIKIISQKR